jgi:Down syndrome cell adhesion protein
MLSVLIRPVIDPFLFPKSLHQGQRYTILCSVSKGDLPVSIKWFKDGRIISSASGIDPEFAGIGVINVSPFASNLVFESLRPEHMGNYTCMASNGAGSVTHNGSMVVHVPPKWMIEARDTSVLKGKTALIDCQADGFPPPSVRWSKTDGKFSSNSSTPSLPIIE